MKQIGRTPIFIERGDGPYIWDVDGNRYVDWVSSWGPLILGHADPLVVEAVRQSADRGTSYGAPTPGEVALAAEVGDRFRSVEMVRMTSSGTEATKSALRKRSTPPAPRATSPGGGDRKAHVSTP